jgi:hypothetical protein
MDTTSSRRDDSIESRARRRVNLKMGFIIHASVFLVVNAFLYLYDHALGGTRWSHFPLWGWGLGLAIHGVVVLIRLQGEGLRSSMLAREIERLRREER